MPIPLNKLRKMYLCDLLSMNEIADKLNCSINKVNYWMIKHKITRRNHQDASYFKYNRNGDPYQIEKIDDFEKTKLYYLAIGLFWGEGNKKNPHDVRIGNSDPKILYIWCDFLRKICRIKENKIHFHLQTFKDNQISLAKSFWAQQLRISPDRITSGKSMSPLGKGSYKKTSKYGVLTVGVYNTHFRNWMMEQLYKLGYNPNL